MIARRAFKLAGLIVALLLVAAVAAPYIAADRYGGRLQASLERALGRRVELKARLTFSLLHGPAFRVDGNGGSGVIIHEDPALGLEPIAYVGALEVRPCLWRLLLGKFVIDSIRLEDASINLTKTGPASEWGRWNFASMVSPSMIRALPAIQVRGGRINFKFGNEKTIFYLTGADADIGPPVAIGRGWDVDCAAQLARTDRPATGLGSFHLKGKWYVEPERVDLNLAISDTGLNELTALMRGEPGGIHGDVSAQLHLAGPVDGIGVLGRLRIDDVHRWDLLPTRSSGLPLDIRGRIDLIKQQVYLESNSTRDVPLPISVRLRITDYLSQPHLALGLNWNHFPAGPLMQLARDMGAQFPPKLELAGTVDGAMGYSGQGTLQGTLGFHGAALAIPDSPPLRFEDAYLVIDHGHVRLSPASVLSAAGERATLEADYSIDDEILDLAIATASMNVASLRSQVALAAVPWLDKLESGEWSGQLRYRLSSRKSAWSGDLDVRNAQIAVPGLADPLLLASAHARLDGSHLALGKIDARAGKIAFTGDYQYESEAPRPHRVRLRADTLDAADLEAEFQPTLRRDSSLIARAFGRSSVPAWMKQRAVEGSITVNRLELGTAAVDDLKARLVWDVSRVELDNLSGSIGGAPLSGKAAISLRGAHPVYSLDARVKGLDLPYGSLDAQVSADTQGTGPQLLANLRAEGTMSAAALDFGTALPWRCVSGTFSFAWSGSTPKLRLAALRFNTGGEIYTGQGVTQDGGRLLLTLTNGPKEVRISGLPSALKAEDIAVR
jgi:hypothetical protein